MNRVQVCREKGCTKWVGMVVGAAFLLTTLLPGTAAAAPKTLVWGSASLGASGYVIIEALTSTLNKYEKSFRNASISTQGSTENLILLSQDEISLGQTTSSDLFLAYNGMEPFRSKIEFNQVMSYIFWAFLMGVPEDSDITALEQLDGKRVGLGPAGGASVALWQGIFDEMGIKVKPVFLPWQGAADALKTGQIEAVVVAYTLGKTVIPAFKELSMTKPFKLLPMDKGLLDKVRAKNVGILETEIHTEDGKVHTSPGFSGILVADPRVDEDLVYKICSTLYGHQDQVQKIAKHLEYFKLDNALKMVIPQYPIHKGAVKYYKEKGVWKEGLVEAE